MSEWIEVPVAAGTTPAELTRDRIVTLRWKGGCETGPGELGRIPDEFWGNEILAYRIEYPRFDSVRATVDATLSLNSAAPNCTASELGAMQAAVAEGQAHPGPVEMLDDAPIKDCTFTNIRIGPIRADADDKPRYTCPQGCGWAGSDDHAEWMAHHCGKPSGGGKLAGDHYYRVQVPAPIAPDVPPYTAECADIIEALGMTFNEGEAFKALWRLAAGRQGRVKNKPQYDADKVAHYGARVAACIRRGA